jgi:hypothetical protein
MAKIRLFLHNRFKDIQNRGRRRFNTWDYKINIWEWENVKKSSVKVMGLLVLWLQDFMGEESMDSYKEHLSIGRCLEVLLCN